MHNERKVYVVNRGAHDFSEAQKHGHLVYMTEGFQPRFSVNTAYRRFEFCMQDSSEEDWLLLTGLSTLNAVASAIFAVKHNRLNLLLFNGKTYTKRTLIFDGGTDGNTSERTQVPRHED